MGSDQKINVCHLMSGDLWAGPEVLLYTLLESFKAEPGLGNSVILLNDGKLAQKLRQAGIDTCVIDENRYGFLAIRKKIIDQLRGRRTDIIHSHRYKENILASMVKKPCGVKYLVQTVHGVQEHFTGWKKFKAGLYMTINNYYSRKNFDRVLPVSYDIERNLIALFGRRRLVTIHNAVNPQKIAVSRAADQVRAEFGLNANNPVIGAAGRMVPVKGFDILLDAAKLLLEKKPAVRLLLAGEGPHKDELRKQCRDMGLDGKVQFIGFRNDITDIINCLDLFVISSHHEGIPMILLEAMALQKPVVCTAVGGVKEIVEDGVSGLLVQPGNAQALAEACLTVLNNPDLRMRLGVASRKRIRDEFSVDTQRSRLMNVYRELMGQS